MSIIIRTDSANPDFRRLVSFLDGELRVADGEEAHGYYSQFNKIDGLRHTLVAYHEGEAAGCGSIKLHSDGCAELKRMYVLPQFRRLGIAGQMVKELENWAMELSCTSMILETGIGLTGAVRLYQQLGYTTIPNYGQYIGITTSVCMQKVFPGSHVSPVAG